MCITIKQLICQDLVSHIENGIRIDRLSSDSSSGIFHFASAKLTLKDHHSYRHHSVQGPEQGRPGTKICLAKRRYLNSKSISSGVSTSTSACIHTLATELQQHGEIDKLLSKLRKTA